jgi:VanZ family protein
VQEWEAASAASLLFLTTMLKHQLFRRDRLWRYLPLVLWILFISFASTAEFSAVNTSTVLRPLVLWFVPTLSESQLATVHFVLRKLGHFTEYAILAFLARRAFVSSSYTFLRRYSFECALVLVVSYALLDEFHQSFVPSRTASIYDSAIDVAGGITILLLLKILPRSPSAQVEQT